MTRGEGDEIVRGEEYNEKLKQKEAVEVKEMKAREWHRRKKTKTWRTKKDKRSRRWNSKRRGVKKEAAVKSGNLSERK